MARLKLYYATNRRHEGRNRWRPTGYSRHFSQDGIENLRFGVVRVTALKRDINACLERDMSPNGTGNGEALASYLAKQSQDTGTIRAYPEKLSDGIAESAQDDAVLGSRAMLADLQEAMTNAADVLVYVHGFNVNWHQAVGTAMALQLMMQAKANLSANCESKDVVVVLFTWPSDGLMLPWVSYKSDRAEARGSGASFGRALLKTRDYLHALHDRARNREVELCDQQIHLLCHSMGNYLLQEVIDRLNQFTPGRALPRLFDQVFLCAPDVDDTALEPGEPLGQINQLARQVSVYHNRGDTAMVISDYSKGQPERLGGAGAARPGQLHRKVHQVDCSGVVTGLVEHSYYLVGNVAADIRQSIDGVAQRDSGRRREETAAYDNVWLLR
ncbi:alpha/beta hydrolase [Pseudohalioglobus sediminis]|uniref:Alpha/beta hydrolase n=1 Tax=Pseudohalioglobus sediminis TaxID=2606449 RepID=A0A5B0WSC2_9GAMM|nr:alpha/beta hydrolase [Pseudohalioglobus sediminis]KAA1189141.1 alpha/beta hydrolase [Pseudohalioglobus sediminis]